jgi:hypothetical protein
MTTKAKARARKPATPGFLACNAGLKATVNRWAKSLDRQSHTMESILVAAGYTTVRGDQYWRARNFECGACGVSTITATGEPAVFLKHANEYPANPTRLICEACNWFLIPSTLVAHLFPGYNDRERFLQAHFAGHHPQPRRYYAAKFADKTVLKKTAAAAALEVLPPEHGCKVELCAIEALDEELARERLQSGDAIPWLECEVTPAGEPTVLGWHSQKPTLEERGAYDRVKQQLDHEKRSALESEARAWKAERETELGL